MSLSVLACTEVYPGVPGSDVAACVVCSVLGTWFYVMEYVAGRVFTDPLLPGLTNSDRRRVYESMCQVLACIHSVDINAAQLHDLASSATPRIHTTSSLSLSLSVYHHHDHRFRLLIPS